MTGKYKYIIVRTIRGYVGILGSEQGLRLTTLPQPTEDDAEHLLHPDEFFAEQSHRPFQDLIQRIVWYYEGNPVEFPDELDLSGSTPFQCSVWQTAVRIPYGETRSYGWVAAQIGKPAASRAVGQALHRNPLPLIVPCHRVIGGNGKLMGFGGGIDMKKTLLELEKQVR